MRILAVSDTHGNQNALIRACTLAGDTDMLIHLGDGESDCDLLLPVFDSNIIKVAGNCDMGSDAPSELVIEIEGKRVLLTHGDRYYVKSSLEKLIKHGESADADLVLYGHTHIPRADLEDNMLVINPGTLCLHSSHRSFAIITIEDEQVEFSLHDLT